MMSRPAVHPLDSSSTTIEAPAVPTVRMKDFQGMPGTTGGLLLRLCQFGFAVISLCVMATTSDFPSVTAFSYLVAAVSLQCLWSLLLAIADIYALSVRRSFRSAGLVSLFTIGDGITSTLTFAAACASAGITVLIGNDLDRCNVNHCKRFMSATAMAFLSWFSVSPSFFLNFWSLASQ
ncbi:OLC1v1034568C1 [Oldenlandia corymbosa var. corymbosa]|uniref:CASP-like protein n=1 Tax=Oldenlandia corymbosa var. corymbosa TaxID=529605 RepID=A0AAV1CTI3_OLDCO|nr:OLC1v1034568C1 [Oldenlandia corymbosa var. corymbosa]